MSYFIEIEVELSERVSAVVDVEFECVHPGYNGTLFEPPEGPEFEIVAINLIYMTPSDDAWTKTADDDLPDWVMERIWELVEDYNDLYECQYWSYAQC